MSRDGRHRSPSSTWQRKVLAGVAVVMTVSASGVAWASSSGTAPSPRARPSETRSPTPSVATAAVLEPKRNASTPAEQSDPTTVPVQGAGTFDGVAGQGRRVGDEGQLIRYRVEVEDGLDIPADRFASAVDATLGDRRGWTADRRYSFQRAADADLRIVLASPATTDALCAPLQTRGEVSCRNGDNVVINAKRWVQGVKFYDKLSTYRQYVVNHEVGHALGMGHVTCPYPGAPAPVMLQQTLGLDGCEANPWP